MLALDAMISLHAQMALVFYVILWVHGHFLIENPAQSLASRLH